MGTTYGTSVYSAIDVDKTRGDILDVANGAWCAPIVAGTKLVILWAIIMNKKTAEKIATIALAAFLVGMFAIKLRMERPQKTVINMDTKWEGKVMIVAILTQIVTTDSLRVTMVTHMVQAQVIKHLP